MLPTDTDGFADRTLRDLLRSDGRLSFERAAELLADAAEALAPMHAAGQAHGAITPQSLHIDAAGRARLGPPASDVTAAGLMPPAYLAPERIGGQAADPRSDVYALGLLGWEMLTGQTPWAGASLQELVLNQQEQDLPRLTTVRPGVPRPLLLAIEGALHKAPSDRWANAGELLATLRPTAAAASAASAASAAAVGGPAASAPIEEPRPARPRALGPITAHREPAIPAVPVTSRTTRKSTAGRKFAMVALLLAVLLAGGAAVASMQGRAKQTVTASWLDSLTTTTAGGVVVTDDTSQDTAARLRARAVRDSIARADAAGAYPPAPMYTTPEAQAQQQLQQEMQAQQQLQAQQRLLESEAQAAELQRLRAEAARQRALADSIAAAARAQPERTEPVRTEPAPVPIPAPTPARPAPPRDSARDSARVPALPDTVRPPATKPDSVKPDAPGPSRR
jgi:serine/threonine-protein kinase